MKLTRLAKIFDKLHTKSNPNDIYFTTNFAKFFGLQNDDDAARFRAEQDLIKQTICAWLDGAPLGADSTAAQGFAADENYDKVFRAHIVAAMSKHAISPERIEYGLETNAALWREKAMRRAFDNRYYPLALKALDNHPDWQSFRNSSRQSHQDAWVRLREHEYYRQHKKTIDTWCLHTENMALKPTQLHALSVQAATYHNQYNALLHAIMPQLAPETTRVKE